MAERRTSIMVENATKNRLATYGYVNDTYENVIIKLMDRVDELEKLLSEYKRNLRK